MDDECHERVVLVSVRGGAASTKPKRKVAIALPPENDYEVFVERVRKKLNLQGVGGIFHSESNIPVYNLSDLQDIDDLVVEECEASGHLSPGKGSTQMIPNQPPPSPGMTATSSRKPRSSTLDGKGTIDPEAGAEDDDKYAKRSNPVMRFLRPFTPGLLRKNSPTLPLTSKDLDNSRGQGTKRRRKGNNPLDPRKLLLGFALISCIATMILLYSRISAGLPLESTLSPGEHDHLLKSETLTLGVGGRS